MNISNSLLSFYAQLSQRAYSFVAQQEGIVEKTIDKDDVQVLIIIDNIEQRVLVVFRGSDSLIDWIHDFRVFKRNFIIPYDNMVNSKVRVHSGFLAYWMKVRTELSEILIQYSDYKHVFTGHSLGGAIAQLASLDNQYQLALSNINFDISCVTFGAPKVGNKAFVESRDLRVPNTLNVVNADDPVFHQPWSLLGYVRSGPTLEIGVRRRFWVPSLFRTKDHSISQYIANLS